MHYIHCIIITLIQDKTILWRLFMSKFGAGLLDSSKLEGTYMIDGSGMKLVIDKMENSELYSVHVRSITNVLYGEAASLKESDLKKLLKNAGVSKDALVKYLKSKKKDPALSSMAQVFEDECKHHPSIKRARP